MKPSNLTHLRIESLEKTLLEFYKAVLPSNVQLHLEVIESTIMRSVKDYVPSVEVPASLAIRVRQSWTRRRPTRPI